MSWYQKLDKHWKYRSLRAMDARFDWSGKTLKSSHGWVILTGQRRLSVRKGYAWDGCSGPTIDNAANMRAGLFHDALYQLMREGLLPLDRRAGADNLLRDLMIEDGAHPWRARYYRWAVQRFGARAAQPSTK